MFRRPHYIAVSAVVLLVLILLNLPDKTAAQLKLALGGLFLPLFGLAGSTQTLTEKAGNAVVPRRVLVKELEQLRKENQELKLQALQSTQVWQENSQLRQAVGWQKKVPWKVKPARVILRDPANWWRTLMIDIGSRDGVITNMPVMTIDGLVGRVNQVTAGSSQVVLLGDPNCGVSGKVVETGDQGVLGTAGASVLDQGLIEFTHLPRQSQTKPGHRVVTSGIGGVFPADIPLGRVVDTASVGFGMYTEARVKLAADLQRLEHVWVMFPQ